MQGVTIMVKKIKKEIQWWIFAAQTVPFEAIAVLIDSDYLIINTFDNTIKFFILISFVTVSVFWWWWAMYRIIAIIETIKKSQKNFEDLKSGVKEVKKMFNEENNRNR